MKIDQILQDSLKDVLAKEDLEKLAESITTYVNEQVDTRVAVKVEELNDKADEFCAKQIEEGIENAKKELEEAKEKEIDQIEENVVSTIDTLIETEIVPSVSDELVESIAVNQTYAPIIEGIRDLFENKFVALDVEGAGKVRELEAKLQEAEEKQATLIAEKIELADDCEKASIKLLVKDKTADLTESQAERVESLVEGKSFEEVHAKIDTFIDIVKESKDEAQEEGNDNDDSTSNAECLEESVDLSDKDKDTVAESTFASANQYL